MCNILLKDPINRLWQVSCTDIGLLQTNLTGLNFPTNDPALVATPNNAWALRASTIGTIQVTKIGSSITAQRFFPLTSPSGKTFTLSVNDNGTLFTTFSPLPIREQIPYPLDVIMSQWPSNVGVTCPRCGNSNITVSGDMSCWCCACQSFVDSEDTTIIIILDE